jgi:hypothetical protein
VRFPIADEEVEVVRAIALRQVRGIVGGLGGLRKKRDGERGAENEHSGYLSVHRFTLSG